MEMLRQASFLSIAAHNAAAAYSHGGVQNAFAVHEGDEHIHTPAYTHTQNAAAVIWNIPHNLGVQFVGVRVHDFNGNELLPEIAHLSANVAILTFINPVQGTARIWR